MRTLLRIFIVLAAAAVGAAAGAAGVALFIRATFPGCPPGDPCDGPVYVFLGLALPLSALTGLLAALLAVWALRRRGRRAADAPAV